MSSQAAARFYLFRFLKYNQCADCFKVCVFWFLSLLSTVEFEFIPRKLVMCVLIRIGICVGLRFILVIYQYKQCVSGHFTEKHKSNVTHNNAFDMLLSNDEANENPIKKDKKTNR